MSLLDIVGSLFDSNQQSQGEKHILQDYRNADTLSLDAANEARNSTYNFYQPYATGGQNAFSRAQDMQTPGYQYSPSDPSYAWRFGEGQRAVQGSAVARGSLNSGGTLKALTNFGQGLASTEFNNDFSRNNLLANYGMQATQGLAGAQKDWANQFMRSAYLGATGRADAFRGKADADSATSGSIFGGLKNIGEDLLGLF